MSLVRKERPENSSSSGPNMPNSPPEEIPSMDDLKEMPVERRAKRSLRWYLVVGIVTLIVAGIIVGVILLVN